MSKHKPNGTKSDPWPEGPPPWETGEEVGGSTPPAALIAAVPPWESGDEHGSTYSPVAMRAISAVLHRGDQRYEDRAAVLFMWERVARGEIDHETLDFIQTVGRNVLRVGYADASSAYKACGLPGMRDEALQEGAAREVLEVFDSFDRIDESGRVIVEPAMARRSGPTLEDQHVAQLASYPELPGLRDERLRDAVRKQKAKLRKRQKKAGG